MKGKNMKKRCFYAFAALCLLCLCAFSLVGCGGGKERVLIYTSMEDYRIEYLSTRLAEVFPEYEVVVEYLPTGNHAARLLAEGEYTECDISYNLEYGYLEKLDQAGLLAELSDFDRTVYAEDIPAVGNYLPQERNGGAILVNTEVLARYGLERPTSYEDLLSPAYRGLISMPDPRSSGTGYMFLLSLANAWGREEALAYFDALTPNVLSYTASGSGPLGALLQGEVAIGLGMIAPAVTEIADGAPIDLLFFEEGAPYSLYGQAMIRGKESREAVTRVFRWLAEEFTEENCARYFPEPLYRDRTFTVAGYPEHILYADMTDTEENKSLLLEAWKH